MITTITMNIDIDYEMLKDDAIDKIAFILREDYGIEWYELTKESQEEIIENFLQEFSK